jgi:hypothetical protein
MARQRPTFAKREREREREARARAKEERRAQRAEEKATDTGDDGAPGDQSGILRALDELHAAYERGEMDLDDFTTRREELTSRLRVD